MTNVQYITDAAGHKTAVILPIKDYETMLDVFIKSATLAAFTPSAKFLNLPEKAIDFIQYLIIASERKWTEDVTLTSEKIAEISKTSPKDIGRGRIALVKYMNDGEGKAVVDIESTTDELGVLSGTIYKLKILQSIENAIKSYFNANNGSVKAIGTFTAKAEKLDFNRTDDFNTTFQNIITAIKEHLQVLPDKPTIIKSQQETRRKERLLEIKNQLEG